MVSDSFWMVFGWFWIVFGWFLDGFLDGFWMVAWEEEIVCHLGRGWLLVPI